MTDTSIPSDRRYTSEHEWAMLDGEVVRIGITDYAQSQLGDVVYVDLPATNAVVTGGQAFGEVESTKSVSDLYAPVSGTVVERNDDLDERPELVNEDPYGVGWLVAIQPDDASALDGLLDADGYRALLP
ncbi:MAG TPA: glycine cleavage system protein GcvH [Nitriliruptorales bacterium]